MCAYVFVSVCVGMCWMFSWEQQGRPGRGGRTESDDATAEKSEIVCVQCVETQIKYGGDSRVLTWGGGGRPVIPEEGKHFKQLRPNCRHEKPNIGANTFPCAIRKQISDPQDSCCGYEMLKKGQCSSWKSISFTSSADSIRTTMWQVYISHHLM